jgi:hypothetical protein
MIFVKHMISISNLIAKNFKLKDEDKFINEEFIFLMFYSLFLSTTDPILSILLITLFSIVLIVILFCYFIYYLLYCLYYILINPLLHLYAFFFKRFYHFDKTTGIFVRNTTPARTTVTPSIEAL